MPHPSSATATATRRSGPRVAVTLYTPKEQRRLHRIETYTKRKLTPTAVPTAEQIIAQRDSILQEQLLTWLRRGLVRLAAG